MQILILLKHLTYNRNNVDCYYLTMLLMIKILSSITPQHARGGASRSSADEVRQHANR